MKLFAGNSNRVLAEAVARYLNIQIGRASVRRFADQEIFVEIQENVRGEDVFVAATGVTAGALLRGVRVTADGIETESIVMRSRSGTVRRIAARHPSRKLRRLRTEGDT